MKNLFVFMSVVALILTSVAYSLPASATSGDVVYEYGGLDYIISTSAFDTLATATDSTTLLSGKSFSPDWQYILVRNAITGTGSDSVKLAVRVDALDSDGSLLYSTLADSLTTSDGEQILLPIFGSVFGQKIRIKLIAYTGNGGQVILNKFQIYKRRPVNINKTWK